MSADDATRMIADLEVAQGRDPDRRLRTLKEIAEAACFVETPACIRCPERGACQFHASLEQARKRPTGIRRLWGK